jgi:hypothetical protein
MGAVLNTNADMLTISLVDISDSITFPYNPTSHFGKHYRRLDENQPKQPNDIGTVLVHEQPITGDGNCFYYAIFEALQDANLLNDVKLGTTSQEFVTNLRKQLSETIDFKAYLDHLGGLDNETKNVILEYLSKEFQTIINSDAQDKMEQLKKAVQNPRTWASQLEVKETENVLASKNIRLDIKTNNTLKIWPGRTYLYNFNPRRIVLINQNEHYTWYKFSSSGGARQRRTRRKRT